MRIGFEVTAATPKRLRAAEDAPIAETMRGERRITQAPSTDQKKVRRQMTRKTAATFSAGECRMCEGPLIPMGRSGETLKAQCQDCGTKHELQGDTSVKRTAAQRFEIFQNLPLEVQAALQVLAHTQEAFDAPCPHCSDATWGMRDHVGFADGSRGPRLQMKCRSCGQQYEHALMRPGDVGRTAANYTARLLNFVGSQWVVETSTSQYGHTGMSAIARRAQSVLDTEESS